MTELFVKKYISGAKNIAKIFSVIVIATGSAVLTGWALNIERLKDILPSLPSMMVNTAIGLLMAGASLLLWHLAQNKKSSVTLTLFSKLIAIFIILLGVLTISEYLLKVNLGIDQLFFADVKGALQTQIPGRPSPHTSVNFVFVGLALILLNTTSDKKRICGEIFAAASILIALLALLGYVYKISFFYGITTYTGMATHTAVAFLLIGIGLLLSRPEKGFMKIVMSNTAGGIISRWLLPIAVVAPFTIGWIVLMLRQGHGFDDVFIFSLSVLLNIIVFSIVVLWAAYVLFNIDMRLRRETNKTEALLDGIGDGVVAIDRLWSIIFSNKAASTIVGRTQEDLKDTPFRDIFKFVRERDRKENIAFIERAILDAEIGVMENHTVLIVQDGREIPIGYSAAPFLSEDGKVGGAIIIFRDMTKERDSAILKSDFAYASHQFRTPITKVLWTLETIFNLEKDKKIKTHIQGALLSLKSINKLTEQFLEISDIDHARIIPNIEKIKIIEIIDGTLDLVREIAEQKKVTIKIAQISASASIDTDKKLLIRSLYEILMNAVLYSHPKSEVVVNASIQENNLLIEVADSGIGIPEEGQPLVYNKFFRGNNFNTTTIVGTGLGLFVTKEYAKLLNGKVWFESKEGAGSRFFLRLPL